MTEMTRATTAATCQSPGTAELELLACAAGDHRLELLGGFHPNPGDGAPPGTGTLVLLGPMAQGFWPHVTAQPEFTDGAPDPLDRWSARVIGALAAQWGGAALLPFEGPPWLPFQNWALKTARAWISPVAMLVHDTAGLMLSYRGAIALGQHLALPPAPKTSPCASCRDAPCLSACPAGALGRGGYDVAACHDWLATTPGKACMTAGCAARRACPISISHNRPAAQSAYHMRQFHPA